REVSPRSDQARSHFPCSSLTCDPLVKDRGSIQHRTDDARSRVLLANRKAAQASGSCLSADLGLTVPRTLACQLWMPRSSRAARSRPAEAISYFMASLPTFSYLSASA